MRKDLVSIVCCPVHKAPLELSAKKLDEHGDILEGTLRCGRCKFDYPIEEGIPNLLPPQYHLDEVKEKQAKESPARVTGKDHSRKGKGTQAKGSK